MAVTWQNVGASNTSGAASAMDSAARIFDRAFTGLQDLAEKPAALKQAEVKRQAGLDQLALENQRANTRLSLEEEAAKRADTRLEDSLLTSASNRNIAAKQEGRAQTKADQDNTLFNQKQKLLARQVELEGMTRNIVLSDEDPELQAQNIYKLVQEGKITPKEYSQVTQGATTMSESLYGQTEAQANVEAEQTAIDAMQREQLQSELAGKTTALAAHLGVSEEALNAASSGDTDLSAVVKALDSRMGAGEGAELITTFHDKFGRRPTVQEFENIVAQAEEQDAWGFGDEATEWKGWREQGMSEAIDNHHKALGLADPNLATAVNQLIQRKKEADTINQAFARQQEKNLLELRKSQRKTRKANLGGAGLAPSDMVDESGVAKSLAAWNAAYDKLMGGSLASKHPKLKKDFGMGGL